MQTPFFTYSYKGSQTHTHRSLMCHHHMWKTKHLTANTSLLISHLYCIIDISMWNLCHCCTLDLQRRFSFTFLRAAVVLQSVCTQVSFAFLYMYFPLVNNRRKGVNTLFTHYLNRSLNKWVLYSLRWNIYCTKYTDTSISSGYFNTSWRVDWACSTFSVVLKSLIIFLNKTLPLWILYCTANTVIIVK